MSMVTWTAGRFGQAGLRLPPLDVEFHAYGSCGANWGYYHPVPGRIDICDASWRPRSDAKETLLHEMAHAWDGLMLTDHMRREFLAFRGLRSWSGEQTPWVLRGMEQAAEIVSWGLMDRDVGALTNRLTGTLHINAGVLPVAFELLTGHRPFHSLQEPTETVA